MVTKYPSSVPEEELLPMLTCLQQAQAECRRTEVLVWILQCLQALAQSQTVNQHKLLDMTKDACEGLWSKVWAATLRYANYGKVC